MINQKKQQKFINILLNAYNISMAYKYILIMYAINSTIYSNMHLLHY